MQTYMGYRFLIIDSVWEKFNSSFQFSHNITSLLTAINTLLLNSLRKFFKYSISISFWFLVVGCNIVHTIFQTYELSIGKQSWILLSTVKYI